jgi:hypothetical protein
MFAKTRSLRRLAALLSCIALLAVALPPTASMQQPQGPRSIEEFVERAYLGAYNRLPNCFERENGYNTIAATAPNSQARLDAAKRFVATLFMTNSSYDMPPHVYVQTSAYSAINPADSGRQREFVTDLYQAFLQREPDTPGLDFWTNEVHLHGRKQVIRAFELSIEFESIVNQLFDTGVSCCFQSCPFGYTFNFETCSCEPDPYGCGRYGQLCY